MKSHTGLDFSSCFLNVLQPSASSPAMTVEHSFSYYMRQDLLSEVLECAVGPDIWTAGNKKQGDWGFIFIILF